MNILDIPFFGGRLNFHSHAQPVNENIRYEDRANNLNLPIKFVITATTAEIENEKKLSLYRGGLYYADFRFEFNKIFNLVTKEFEDHSSGYYHIGDFHITNYRVCKNNWAQHSNASSICQDLFRDKAFELINKMYKSDDAIVDANDYILALIKSLEGYKKDAEIVVNKFNKLIESVAAL